MGFSRNVLHFVDKRDFFTDHEEFFILLLFISATLVDLCLLPLTIILFVLNLIWRLFK